MQFYIPVLTQESPSKQWKIIIKYLLSGTGWGDILGEQISSKRIIRLFEEIWAICFPMKNYLADPAQALKKEQQI